MEKFKANILNETSYKLKLEKYGFDVDLSDKGSFYHAKFINDLNEIKNLEVPLIYLTKNKDIINNENIFSVHGVLEEIFDFAYMKLDESYLNKFLEMGSMALNFIENSMIKNFKTIAKQDLKELKVLMEKKDLANIKSKCHKMKSSFSTLGLIKTTNLLNDYNKTAKDFNEYDYFSLVRNFESDCLFLDEYLLKIKKDVA